MLPLYKTNHDAIVCLLLFVMHPAEKLLEFYFMANYRIKHSPTYSHSSFLFPFVMRRV